MLHLHENQTKKKKQEADEKNKQSSDFSVLANRFQNQRIIFLKWIYFLYYAWNYACLAYDFTITENSLEAICFGHKINICDSRRRDGCTLSHERKQCKRKSMWFCGTNHRFKQNRKIDKNQTKKKNDLTYYLNSLLLNRDVKWFKSKCSIIRWKIVQIIGWQNDILKQNIKRN